MLIKLTLPSGNPVYVNTNKIKSIQHDVFPDGSVNKTKTVVSTGNSCIIVDNPITDILMHFRVRAV